jgi:hypothetical protein
MRVLRPSREKREPGDVFVYQMPDGLYRFGRLVARDIAVGGFERSPAQHLVYFYRGESATKDVLPDLDNLDFLVPPLVVNQKPWTLGYFERVARAPITAGQRLPTHCFRDSLRGRYFDETGSELSSPVEPCGEWALQSYRTVDDTLSSVLGFDLVPDESAA